MWITESRKKYEAIQHNKAVASFKVFDHFNKVVEQSITTVTEAMNTTPTGIVQNQKVLTKIIASVRVDDDLRATSKALVKESPRFTSDKLRTALLAVSALLVA